MAIMATLMFSTIFQESFSLKQKLFAGSLVILMLFLIYRSNARQGLLSLFLGIGIFLIIWLYGKSRILGIFASTTGILIFIFATLGMLQLGPLERYLYKSSVSVRGYYWRAGLEMFKDNPLLGVGMDRYGAYFMQYREVGYPLSYGFDLTSSNAHNTFIQFFATGGFFLGATYVALQIFILITAIKSLRRFQEKNRLILAGLFSSWVAFHAQSLVSIDNLGVSIWGWILGGSIVGFSASISEPSVGNKKSLIRNNQINLKQVLVSTAFALPIAILISGLYRAENNAFKASIPYETVNTSSRDLFKQAQLNAIKSKLLDPNYSIKMAQNLIQGGFVAEGVATLEKIHADDYRNLDAINLLALTFEAYDQIPKAIEYREKMAILNPWNAANYLALVRDYKKQGDMIRAREALDKILSFATGVNGGPIAEQAIKELS
jgi:tetratricopeptide (TPR) repeat protein